MHQAQINLAVFDSSKGHHGIVDIYKTAISNLDKNLPLTFFSKKIVHIKVDPSRPEEEIRANGEMSDFYRRYGFEIYISYGNWQHFNVSHQQEYISDIIKMYRQYIDPNIPYSLHLEADWCWSINGPLQLSDYIGKSIHFLNTRPQILSVRFPRFVNEPDRMRGLKAKHNMDVEVEKSGDFYLHNDNLSLNPALYRTSDLRAMARLAEINFNRLTHSEHDLTALIKWLSPSKLPFSFIDPKLVNVCHQGTKKGEEDIVGKPIFAN